MKTVQMMYGNPREVAEELMSTNEPEDILHVDIIAALANALNRIADLEKRLGKAENDAGCRANGIIPD